MKKWLVFVLLSILLISLVSAPGPEMPQVGPNDGVIKGAEKVSEAVPLGPDGKIDEEKFAGFKSKAEGRLEELDVYTKAVSNFIFGVELGMTWTFIVAIIMWILLIELIVMPVKEIFKINIFVGLLVAGIISTIAFRSFGDGLVVWIDSLLQTWYAVLLAIVSAIIVGFVYAAVMHFAGDKIEKAKEDSAKEQTAKDRAVIHVSAEAEKKSLEGYKNP